VRTPNAEAQRRSSLHHSIIIKASAKPSRTKATKQTSSASAAKSSMPLEVHPCTPADFPDFVRIQCAAFSGGIASYIIPTPVTDEWIANRIAEHTKKSTNEPDARYLKVIDTDKDGKMIACAKWRINEKERTEEEIQGQLPVPGKEEEGRPAAQDFMRYLNESRREFMGTAPFYCKCSGVGLLGVVCSVQKRRNAVLTGAV
jgi:hypothetical protein